MSETPRSTFLRGEWPRVAALAGLTLLGVYLCWRLLAPFLPGVTWAVALAVVALPLHRRLTRWVSNPNWAAGLSTAVVVAAVAVPTALVMGQLATESKRAMEVLRGQLEGDQWRGKVGQIPLVGEQLAKLDLAEVEARANALAGQLFSQPMGVVEGVFGGLVQSLVAVFVLFFCLRDRHRLLAATKALLPLREEAADRVIHRAADAVHATVSGTLLAAVVQGVTGGLVFWAVGLPAPVLWGVVMVVLGVLPFVGAFLVWVPAAAFLAADGRWGAAIGVTAWGLIMAGPVCNILYTWAAGDRMRMHPVPTLLAFIGGLAAFGVSGMILGPCLLAATAALLRVWQHRTADGTPVDAKSTPSAHPVVTGPDPVRVTSEKGGSATATPYPA